MAPWTREKNGLSGHRVDAGQVGDADRTLYQWLNGRTAKGVGVVSCVHRGRDYAATVTDFLSVSYDPPTMAAEPLLTVAHRRSRSGIGGLGSEPARV